MERTEFIKSCMGLCLGGLLLDLELTGCVSANHFAKSINNNNVLSIPKTEFIIENNRRKKYRKYVLVKAEQFGFPIGLYKHAEDNYAALLMQCTHQGCELQANNQILICPCHGSEFNSFGVVQNPPAERNLKSFKTSTNDETIFIEL